MDGFGGRAKANQGKGALDYKGEEDEAGECEGKEPKKGGLTRAGPPPVGRFVQSGRTTFFPVPVLRGDIGVNFRQAHEVVFDRKPLPRFPSPGHATTVCPKTEKVSFRFFNEKVCL